MKTLYFECNMGAAGDMLMASLLELHDDPKEFLSKLNNIGIPGVRVTAEPSVKHGITGTHIKVEFNGREETPDMADQSHTHEHNYDANGQGHDHNNNTHDYDHDSHTHKDDRDSHTYDHDHDHDCNHDCHTNDDRCDHETCGHSLNSYQTIEQLISQLNVFDTVKENAVGIYKLIARAESHVHGVPVSQIHFHEIGEMDAIADIIGVCMLIEELAPDRILASPIHVGSGQVRCTHGTLPVPAPATAYILRDTPIYGGDIYGELCTPTGAAILKYFVSSFSPMPVMKVTKIGYGMGKKDFTNINCVRAYIGSADCINEADDINEADRVNDADGINEKVAELVCNLDDMTPEAVAFAQQLMLDSGALDVYVTPMVMKKGRMGSQFTCMCRVEDKDKMLSMIFRHTTTLGIREYVCRRYTLTREQFEAETKYGPVRVKTAHGFGVKKSKPEYDDIANIAQRSDISIQDILKDIDIS